MSENKLLKKLKTDPKFIPFNEKYDIEHIIKYTKEIEIQSNYEIDIKFKAYCSMFFNQYFKNLSSYFLDILNKNKLSKNTFIDILISLANRDLYLMSVRTHESMESENEFHYDKFVNSSFQSSIPEFGLINAQAGLEAGHDGLNTLLNLINKTDDEWTNTKVDFNILDNCAKILGFSNIFTVIKSTYDIAIWENYSMTFHDETKELKIKCQDIKLQYLNRIGEYRLERNIFSAKSIVIKGYLEKNSFYNYISMESEKKRKPKRLKSVTIIDNKLIYKLADGKETKSILKELLEFSELTSYYAFIRNEILPNFIEINLYDILVIYSEIQHLFKEGFDLKKNESTDNFENINLYKIQIPKNELLDYLFAKTKYSKIQLKQLIELFSCKDTYYNIWERPLIENNNNIIPILLPLLNGNILRITDYWLEKGGFDLDARGNMFEKHIKSTLAYELKKKGFLIKIPEKNIFKNKYDNFEEIDLVLELKNVTLIAEIKCIKYPFDPRDYHNMHKRLIEGAEQVKRKTFFLKNHIEDFKEETFLSKKIISTVITNYPIFSGHIIDGIPITDFSLLENYFINGALNKGHMAFGEKKLDINENLKKIKYYENENELSDNLEDFLMNPTPIKDKMDDLYIEETQISLPKANPKILMDYINFKEPNLI